MHVYTYLIKYDLETVRRTMKYIVADYKMADTSVIYGALSNVYWETIYVYKFSGTVSTDNR